MRDFEGRNYIDGEWKATSEMYTKINPATGKAQGAFPLSGKAEVSKAVLAARRAFNKWKKVFRIHAKNTLSQWYLILHMILDSFVKYNLIVMLYECFHFRVL